MNQEPLGTPALDPATNPGLRTLLKVLLGEVRADGSDLSLRQATVLLTIYLTDEPQTVRGLAAHLNVPTPAITRAFNRLCELDLMRRMVDPRDLRSIIAQRTPRGSAKVQGLEGHCQLVCSTAALGRIA